MKGIRIFQRIRKMDRKLRLKPKDSITVSDGRAVITLSNPSNCENVYFEVIY